MTAGRYLFLILLILSPLLLAAQRQKTKTQLQKEKEQNVEKIKEVERILSETAAKKKNSLGELSALSHRIEMQESLIHSIEGEVGYLDSEIQENNDIIQALEADLKKIRKEYASMIYAAQKANNSATRLMFLFSAESFDQLVMRLQYMQQYSNARKLQAEQISKVQEELQHQVSAIEKQKAEKNKLLKEEITENKNLTSLKGKQNTLVRSLVKEEKKLKKDLDETKKAIANLDKLINDIIREEMARESRENKSKSALALSSSFEENKLKFPWPAAGFISQKFGRQKHPVLKNIEIQNDGINIQTKQAEKVRSIFEGEVRQVAFIQIIGNTVIINHGEYYTVYSGLREVYVKRGQKVTTNQEIGEVFSNSEGIAELRFQIRKNTAALDPEKWLRN